MQKLKENWPTIAGLVFVVGVFLLENAGKLTADQVGQVFALFGLGGLTATRHMSAPGQS